MRRIVRFQKAAFALAFIAFTVSCLAAISRADNPPAGPTRSPKVVYLVPDLPTFLYYLSHWNGDERFPIFITRNRYFEKFVRAYKPEKILKARPRKLERIHPDLLRGAVYAAWGKETLKDLPRGVSASRFKNRLNLSRAKPEGLVLTAPDARQLPAALALAAAHRQLLDFLQLSSSVQKVKLTEAMTFEQKEEIRKEILKIMARWDFPYKSLGDDIDSITLALDLPIAYMGSDPATGTRQRLCLDDGINRLLPDGSIPSAKKEKGNSDKPRGDCYAYVGRLLEAEEGMSLYQAMCSIFLGTGNALYFDSWPERLGLRSQEGWWVMQTRIQSTLVKPNQSSMARWRQLVGTLNPYGFVHVSSAGGSRQWGSGKVSDIPESVPAIVYFAHSFSAANPYDETTIAGRWLRNGAYIYFGAMSEPFAQSFNAPRTVALAATVSEPLGKAFQAKKTLHPRFTFGWKQIYIGDPLHRMRFTHEKKEPETSRTFRQAIRMIRDMDIGPAIEALENALESAQDAAERQRIWDVLNRTFRLRFFALRTRRTPIESHLGSFFIDSWYNDTYYANGIPTTAVVMNKRLNLFLTELLRLYEGLYRTLENKPRLKEFLAGEMAEMKKNAAFAKIFLCAGPFTAAEDANPENPFRPEQVLRLGATWQATSKKIGWQAAMVDPDNNFLDLAALYEGSDSVIYAAYLPVLAKGKGTPVRLHISPTDGVEVWLNNVAVRSVTPTAGQAAEEETVALKLQPGENLVFLKVFRTGTSCRLSARLTDLNGDYLDEVSYADVVAKLSAAGVKIDPERWKPGT